MTSQTFDEILRKHLIKNGFIIDGIFRDSDEQAIKTVKDANNEWLSQKYRRHKKLETLTRSPKISEMHYWKAEEDRELLEELIPPAEVVGR